MRKCNCDSGDEAELHANDCPAVRVVTVHCWASGPPTSDGCSTSCMAMDGHDGKHQWTRDDEITVTFKTSAQEEENK